MILLPSYLSSGEADKAGERDGSILCMSYGHALHLYGILSSLGYGSTPGGAIAVLQSGEKHFCTLPKGELQGWKIRAKSQESEVNSYPIIWTKN